MIGWALCLWLFAQGSAPQVRALVTSPLADTLHAITGRPASYRFNPTPSPEYAALYIVGGRRALTEPPQDTIVFYPGAFDPASNGLTVPAQLTNRGLNVEWVLIHELGHRYGFGQVAGTRHIGEYWSTVPGMIDRVRADSLRRVSRNWYARSSAGEHTAQAFASAVQYLRDTARLPPTPGGMRDAEALASVFEREIAGTAEVVDHLLTLPIYTRHMLNRQHSLVAPPDGTSTTTVYPWGRP